MSDRKEIYMIETTAVLTAVNTAPTEVDTDSIGVVISSALNSSATEKDKIEIILTAIGNKLLDILPALGMALFSMLVGFLFSKALLHVLHKILHRSNIDSAAGNFLTSVVKIALYILILLIALSIINVPITSLIAVLSAAGLAIGLALQNSLSNIAGGFIILFSKPFKAGDFIETNSASGNVESISILYTRILTLDGKTVYIPNGSVANSSITNYSEKGVRRVDLEFGISYSDDLEHAKEVIMEVADAHELILREPRPPFVRLKEQAEDCLNIRVEVWTTTQAYWQVKYDMTELVNAAFQKENITVPFRQLDIHIQKEDI